MRRHTLRHRCFAPHPTHQGGTADEGLPTSAGHWVGARSCRTRASTRPRSGPVTRLSASVLRLTASLSRVRIISKPRAQPAGLQDPPRQVGDPGVACPDRSRPIVPSEGGQFHSEAPRLGPGNLDAEANDLFVVSTADPIERPDPGRDLGDVVLPQVPLRSCRCRGQTWACPFPTTSLPVVGRPLGASRPDPIEVCRRHLAVRAP
jgi:hypothetical protein